MTAQKLDSKAPRIAFFDGYRGLLILIILFYYFFQHILPGGFLAVNAFLMVAGFFAFRHFYLADLKGKKTVLRHYWASRLQRLFFPMLFMVLATVTFILIFAPNYFYNLRNMGLSSLAFLNNYYQILSNQSYFVQAANPSAFTHLWYISLYAQLIFLTPIMVKLFYSWHRNPMLTANALLVLTVISAVLLGYWYQDGKDPSRIYYDLLTRGFAFTAGGALGLLFPAQLRPKPLAFKKRRIFNIVGTVCVVLMFLMLRFMYGTMPFAYRFGMALFTFVSIVFVMVSLHPDTFFSKVMSFKGLTFFGKRSLSYYLWFYPVHLVIPDKLGSVTNLWWNALIQFVIIMGLAEISYRLFEQRQLILPFGQDFDWLQTKRRVRYLIRNRGILIGVKALAIFYALTALVGSIAMLAAPEQKGEVAQRLEQVINQNASEESSSESTAQEVKVINNIDGLTRQEILQASALEVTFIGDSILLASEKQIIEVFPKAVNHIDGLVGRQLYQSVEVVRKLIAGNKLQPVVVTILGSNGTFTAGQLNDYIEAIGTDKEQYFLTSATEKAWVADANQQLFAAAKRYNNVHIIDWRTYSQGHSDWFEQDGIHPSATGALEMAKEIARQIVANH